MPCKLCGAEGVNSTTCPLNPEAKNKKYEAHKVAGAGVAVLDKPKAKPVPKKVEKVEKLEKLEKVEKVEKVDYKVPKGLTKKQEDEFIADVVRLRLSDPSLKGVKSTVINPEIENNCSSCLRYINGRLSAKKLSEYEVWRHINEYCSKCANLISTEYYDHIDKQSKYRKNGAGNDLKKLNDSGAENSFYNSVMHSGAKYWSELAGKRMEGALPSLKGLRDL